MKPQPLPCPDKGPQHPGNRRAAFRTPLWGAALALFSLLAGSVGLQATDVFSDDFARADADTGTTVGSTALGNGWTMHSDLLSGTDVRGGARITGEVLQIGQTTPNSYAGAGGSDRTWVWRNTSSFPAPWSTTLSANPEPVVWSFNIRTGQGNPTPVSTSGGATTVAVLATAEPGSGDWQFGANASGYIVTYNDAGGVDPLKLVRMQNGVRNESGHTTMISAVIPPFNDLTDQYLSVRVTYDPATHQWRLHARNDNGFFQDPGTGNLTFLGSATDNTYTGTPLPYMGFLGNSNNGINGSFDDLRFDNVRISVLDQVEAPSFSPGEGTFPDTTGVTITTTPAAAEIRYTLDGSDPSPTQGTVYTGPVSIGTAPATLKAIAYRAGLTNSPVSTAAYQFQAGSPVFTPARGNYVDVQNVTLTSATPGATFRYTLDGSDPTPTTGTLYTGSIPLSGPATIRALAYKDGIVESAVASADYQIQTAAPVFTPPAGTWPDVQNVTITSATPGASIRYTLDGTEPTSTTGLIYTGPITVNGLVTLQAIAYKAGLPDSLLTSGDYVIRAAPPVFSPVAGTYNDTRNITLTTATPGATIRYTLDGTTPTLTTGLAYTGPVAVTSTTTLIAVSFKTGLAESETAQANYIIEAGAPRFNPPAGTYASTQNVVLSSVTPGALIRYTTDGSDPTPASGTLYNGPVPVSAATTLKAIAYKPGIGDSPVAVADYLIDTSFALVLDDSFTDGDFTNGEDALDSQWRIHTNTTATTLSALNGTLEVGRTGVNGNGFNPGVITDFPVQTLAVGQTITLSFNFSILGSTSTTPNAAGLRFGLYNSGGTSLTGNLTGNPPQTLTTFQNDVGYSVFAPVRGSGNQEVTLRYRSSSTSGNVLQISLAANATIATGSLETPITTNTTYPASLAAERLTATTYKLTATYAGATVITPEYTPALPTNTFDTLTVFSIINATATYQGLSIDNVRVSVATPSPASSLATWRALQGLAADGSQDLLNPSGDGLPNLVKYALNLAPEAGDLAKPAHRTLTNPSGTTVADLTGLPLLQPGAGQDAVFTFIRRKASTNPGLLYTVQWSDGLSGWQANAAATTSVLSLDSTWERVAVTDSFTPGQKARRFARLQIQATP